MSTWITHGELALMVPAWSEALIEIATAFDAYGPDPDVVVVDGVSRAVPNGCAGCHRYFEQGCAPDCPGLLARRALGVA